MVEHFNFAFFSVQHVNVMSLSRKKILSPSFQVENSEIEMGGIFSSILQSRPHLNKLYLFI